MIQVFISRNMPLRRKEGRQEGREGRRQGGRKKKNFLTDKTSRCLYALCLTNWQESDLPFKKLLLLRQQKFHSSHYFIWIKLPVPANGWIPECDSIQNPNRHFHDSMMIWTKSALIDRERRAGLCEKCEDSHEVKNERR